MLEEIFGASINNVFGQLASLSFLVSIIVEILKQIVPKKCPKQLLTIIVSIIVTIFVVILCQGFSVNGIITSVLTGFVVSYISMNGFDTFRNIYGKIMSKDKTDSDG